MAAMTSRMDTDWMRRLDLELMAGAGIMDEDLAPESDPRDCATLSLTRASVIAKETPTL